MINKIKYENRLEYILIIEIIDVFINFYGKLYISNDSDIVEYLKLFWEY